MRRRYLRELYVERIELIKQVMPHCCIGADVIAGFPGETNEDFLDTYKFLNELDISYLHVFTYSERPNTIATEMEEVISMEERKRRSKMLRSLSLKKRRYFYEQHLGESRAVLFESENDNGFMYGFTDNYIKVKVVFDEGLVNEVVKAGLEEIDSEGDVIAESLQFPVSGLERKSPLPPLACAVKHPHKGDETRNFKLQTSN